MANICTDSQQKPHIFSHRPRHWTHIMKKKPDGDDDRVVTMAVLVWKQIPVESPAERILYFPHRLCIFHWGTIESFTLFRWIVACNGYPRVFKSISHTKIPSIFSRYSLRWNDFRLKIDVEENSNTKKGVKKEVEKKNRPIIEVWEGLQYGNQIYSNHEQSEIRLLPIFPLSEILFVTF